MEKAKAARVYLSAEERKELEQVVKEMRSGVRKYKRAGALLLLDRSQGKKRIAKAVAEEVGLVLSTLSQLAKRYVDGGLKAAMEEKPRPGRGVKITGEAEAQLVALACQKPEAGQAKWTMRMLAGRLVELELVDSISHVAVMNRLKKIRSNLGKSKVGVSHPKRTPAL
jgi:transposase